MKLTTLFLLLFALTSKAAPITNVFLQWTDTNNFKPAIVQVIQTNPLVTVTIPAVTAMVYRVYFSTNLLLPVKNWPLWSSVAVVNPTPAMLSTVSTGSRHSSFFHSHRQGSIRGARKRFFYSDRTSGEPIASANQYRPMDSTRTITRKLMILRSPKDQYK
jgi:hypothetical protein